MPAIQISEPAAPAPEIPSEPPRKESKALDVKKPAKNLPTQEVIKGYVHRLKTGGLRSRWEKVFCVITHSAIYFTEGEGNSEYESMFRVVAGEAVFSEKDKGHDKHSKVSPLALGLRVLCALMYLIQCGTLSNVYTICSQTSFSTFMRHSCCIVIVVCVCVCVRVAHLLFALQVIVYS